MAEDLDVRIGSVDDVHAMMDIALAATDENAATKPNPMKLLQDIYAALSLKDGVVGIIGEPGGQIEGAVVLRVGSLWYSDELVIEEKAIFVHPDYRAAKGGRARKLAQFSKRVADSMGMTLMIGVLSASRVRAKIRMYEREFGEPSGAFWLYKGSDDAGKAN